MKIIKKGKIPKNDWLGKCTNCGCVVECSENELKAQEDRGQTDYVHKCPTCKQNIYFHKKIELR